MFIKYILTVARRKRRQRAESTPVINYPGSFVPLHCSLQKRVLTERCFPVISIKYALVNTVCDFFFLYCLT